MSKKFDAARLVAKLLAARPTPLDEVPQVIANVQRALSSLGEERPMPQTRAPRPRRRASARRDPSSAAQTHAPPAAEAEAKAAAPTLVRRATLNLPAPPESAPALAPAAGAVRGVVQWFDTRTGQGALRLPGLSRDLPIDAAMLASFGIARLFKGQEIEAELDGSGEQARPVLLRLVNAPPSSPVTGGTVHDRHAKAVVVELKHQSPRRSAARAEAELLLSARRNKIS